MSEHEKLTNQLQLIIQKAFRFLNQEGYKIDS